MDPGFHSFVRTKGSVPMYGSADGDGEPLRYLLWGDGVRFAADAPQHGRRRVTARGGTGWVAESALGGESLLELYFIDVGQGDGVLVKTPDFRHLLIDGGYPRAKQPSRKSAADFVDWKFARDYGVDTIELDAMIASHCDLDHYGGLDDLLDTAQNDELDARDVRIERFFHAGVSWWRGAGGRRTLGAVETAGGVEHLLQLLGDRASVEAALGGAAGAPQLQGAWRAFVEKVAKARDRSGAPTRIDRLSHRVPHLPGFEPGSAGGVAAHVLGPVEHGVGGRPALRDFGSVSHNTNGHSIVLRLDYGRSRILLTGDLNQAAQRGLLEAFEGRRLEFQCDVAKACHHGSDDVSIEFLQAMNAGATVISSGDAEGHDHPRPRIVAASGITGHLSVRNDELVTPLVYSTELARSTLLGDMTGLTLRGGDKLDAAALANATVHYTARKPGAIAPSAGRRRFEHTYVVAGLVYGLVNVRTDGRTLLCATMNEGDGSWSVRSFKSRF